MKQSILFLILLPIFIFSQESPKLKFDKYNDKNTIVIFADNEEICPVSVEYEYTGEI